MWIQISAGRGPEECELAVGNFLRVLYKETETKRWSMELVKKVPGRRRNGIKSALLSITGEDVQSFAREIAGTVCWICKSPYRPKHKRKNWFIDVEIFEERDRQAFCEKDVIVEFKRSSGPGGQNINKVETAVKVTHLPTGLAAVASEERSQHVNKKLAFARLARLLEKIADKAENSEKQSMWIRHNTLIRGNPSRVYEGEDFIIKYK